MVSKYKIWSPAYNYKGSYGVSTKERIHQLSSDRFDQDFFPIEENYAKIANDFAGQYTTPLGLSGRIQRDMALDMGNPREKLPEDFVSAKLIDTIPMYGYSHPPDLSLPEDYKQNDQVALVQQAFLNAAKQEELFTNPRYFDPKSFNPKQVSQQVNDLNTDKVGQGNQPITQLEFYSMDGSAAGRETNFLGTEDSDENYRMNSIESMVAF